MAVGWQSKLLALLVFGALGPLAAKMLWGTIVGLPSITEAFENSCPAPAPVRAPFPATGYVGQHSHAHLPYTQGLWPWADAKLCGLVLFFTAAMRSPAGYQITLVILTSFTPVIAFTFIEAQRNNRSVVLAFPVFLGIVYQLFGAGLTFPAYWLLFLLSDSNKTRSARSMIVDRKRSISVLFALVVGYFAPLYAMMFHQNEYTIAIWQPFPVLMAVAQAIALYLLPISGAPRSGTSIVRLTYIISFLVSAAPYLYVLTSQPGKLGGLSDIFVPMLNPPASLDMPGAAKLFLQWDLIFTLGSSLLVVLWLSRTIQQALTLLVTSILLGITLSPGASFAAVMYWREGLLAETSKAKAR